MAKNTTSPAHTPTPWLPDVVFSEQSQSDSDVVHAAQITTREGEDGRCTRAAVAYGRTVAECRANAAFIVQACNSHEKLLEALDYLLKQTVDMDLAHGIELTEGETEAREKAIAAIAEATGL